MDALQARVVQLEANLTGITTQMGDYIQRMDGMLKKIEDNDANLKGIVEKNDTSLKATIEANDTNVKGMMQNQGNEIIGVKGDVKQVTDTMKDEINQAVAKMNGSIQGLQESMARVDQRITASEQDTISLATDRITPMEIEVLQMKTDAGNFSTGVLQEINTLKLKVEHKGDATSAEGSRDFYKPITEYKVVDSLGKLSNDKSGFRDWKVRMKDALVQVFRSKEFLKMMDFVEDPTTKLTGDEELEEIMQMAEEKADIPQHSETWDKVGFALHSLLKHKAEDKSEAFLVTKRSSNGWIAWHQVNKWYLATSGQGLSERMTKIMTPSQSKKDADVKYDVEKWLDEVKECRALGASEMGYDYMLTALRGIATPAIRDQMDVADAKGETLDHKTRYETQFNVMMNWAHRKAVEAGGKKSDKMDIGGIAGKGGWYPGYDDQQQVDWNDAQNQGFMLGMVKGKGKGKGGYWKHVGGGKDGKGYGKAKGFNAKGGGKGSNGRPIFYGACHGCGVIGHSKAQCPELGKGFKGKCNGCGLRGHPVAQCPKGKGGGFKGYGKGNGINNVNPEESGSGLNLGGGESPTTDEKETKTESGSGGADAQQSQYGQDYNSGYVWIPDSQGPCNMGYAYPQMEDWNQGWGDSRWMSLVSKDKPETEFKVVNRRKDKRDDRAILALNKRMRDLNPGECELEEIEVDGVMDSGAYDTICSDELMGGNEIRDTVASKNGINYYGPNGNPIKNKGEGDLEGIAGDGIPVQFTAQIGESIKKLLISVRRAVKSGNMVIFGADLKAIRELAKLDLIEDNLIVGTQTGIRSKIHDKNGMYVYPMTITRKKKKADPNAMDVGMLQGNQYAMIASKDGAEDDLPF